MYESGERSPHLLTFMLDLMEDKMERETSERESTLKKSLDVRESIFLPRDFSRQEAAVSLSYKEKCIYANMTIYNVYTQQNFMM